jgi:DNA-binding transcriptional regulator LsrR (DeoR family)
MTDRRRARADERAQRVNAAVALLAAGHDVAEAARRLAGRYGLSERQARRYVDRARTGGQVEVPGPKVVFTVKLPATLARRVRRAARAGGQTISSLVTQALTEFLDRQHPRSGDGRGR